MSLDPNTQWVGPVLESSADGAGVIAAIRAMNPNMRLEDRGSYMRILVPDRCAVSRDAIERALGRPFVLPGDLERLMPSFAGVFQVNELEASWSAPSNRGAR